MSMSTSRQLDTRVLLDEDGYRRLVQRFDQLWEYATSERDQREMRRLIRLINEYEASPPA